MSNNVIIQMQQELDKTRHELTHKHNECARLQDIEKQYGDAQDTIKHLQAELLAKQDKAKTEATARSKEQIEALTVEVEKLKKEAEKNAQLLQQTGDECKELVQRVTQAEAHMKDMAATHQAPKPARTFRKDRIRKSQR